MVVSQSRHPIFSSKIGACHQLKVLHIFRNNQNFRIWFANVKIIISDCVKLFRYYYVLPLPFKLTYSIAMNIPTIYQRLIFIYLIYIYWIIQKIRSIYLITISERIFKGLKIIFKKTVRLNELINSITNIISCFSFKNNLKLSTILTFDFQEIL